MCDKCQRGTKGIGQFKMDFMDFIEQKAGNMNIKKQMGRVQTAGSSVSQILCICWDLKKGKSWFSICQNISWTEAPECPGALPSLPSYNAIAWKMQAMKVR